MFVFVEDPQVWWPVTVQQPVDGGGVVEKRFKARFRDVPEARRRELAEQGDEGHKIILREAITSLTDILDANGNAVPFSPELLDVLLGRAWCRYGISRAYGEVLAGMPAEGNSERSAGPGP